MSEPTLDEAIKMIRGWKKLNRFCDADRVVIDKVCNAAEKPLCDNETAEFWRDQAKGEHDKRKQAEVNRAAWEARSNVFETCIDKALADAKIHSPLATNLPDILVNYRHRAEQADADLADLQKAYYDRAISAERREIKLRDQLTTAHIILGESQTEKLQLQAELATAKATITLVTAQLRCEQSMLADCRSLLDGFDIPTNGAEGIGKRQELTVSQRVKLLGGSQKPGDILDERKAHADALKMLELYQKSGYPDANHWYEQHNLRCDVIAEQWHDAAILAAQNRDAKLKERDELKAQLAMADRDKADMRDELKELKDELAAWQSRFKALVNADAPDSAGNAVITLQHQLAVAKGKLGECICGHDGHLTSAACPHHGTYTVTMSQLILGHQRHKGDTLADAIAEALIDAGGRYIRVTTIENVLRAEADRLEAGKESGK